MKHILYAILFVSVTAYSQEFKLSKDGYTPQVIKFDSLTAQQLYTKISGWVKSTYNKPSEVIREDIPGEKLRLFGFMQNAYFAKGLGNKIYMDLDYWLTFEFKDGKVRVSFEVNQIWADGRKAQFSPAVFFKDDGTIRNAYKDAPPSLDQSVNDLIKAALGSITAKKSEW